MPFVIEKRGEKGFCVYTQGEDGDAEGEAHGCHPTREAAVKQLRALYANVPEARKDETMITLGPAIKAMGDGRVGGYLITFGSEATKDSQGEWFTPETDFDQEFPAKASVYYHHGLDPTVGRQRLTHGKMDLDAYGVYIEAQLDLRNRTHAKIYRKTEQGLMGWSSGSVGHITIPPRELPGGAIQQWPLGHDCSMTEIPSDKRNRAVALKSEPIPPLGDPLPTLWAPEEGGWSTSLAENTDRWLDGGMHVLAGYEGIAAKAGRKLSAARRERLMQMRQMIDDLLSETAPQDVAAAEEGAPPPGMGEGAESGLAAAGIGMPSTLPDLHDLYAAAVRQVGYGPSIGG